MSDNSKTRVVVGMSGGVHRMTLARQVLFTAMATGIGSKSGTRAEKQK